MSESSMLNGKKILIVDDEPDVLEVLEEYLKMCRLVKATSFEEARDLLESQDFDAAILDIMGVKGYDLLEIATRKKIPALMLTAHAFTPEDMVKSVKEGAASYVPKEEITRIEDFLNDIFVARAKGESPWISWQQRMPGTYFEMKFGAAWKAASQEFRDALKASIKSRAKTLKKE
ncbi:MAG: response regulator [Deltaproteobacteria bacterium]|nr:response regulator [Deltaproteobacteria bacterium]MBW2016491.1 response regulator [Deltaproteobacteria bacterium]MBW2128495.1 response regulator [Deltaproteobacteria bacterium]MBW2303646.1 response regulator [Deltaproteobacteria bacterium]